MTKQELIDTIRTLLEEADDLDGILELRPGKTGEKFYGMLNLNDKNITVNYQGEKITGRFQGNIFLQDVKTSEFAQKKPAQATKAATTLADLRAALKARQ